MKWATLLHRVCTFGQTATTITTSIPSSSLLSACFGMVRQGETGRSVRASCLDVVWWWWCWWVDCTIQCESVTQKTKCLLADSFSSFTRRRSGLSL